MDQSKTNIYLNDCILLFGHSIWDHSTTCNFPTTTPYILFKYFQVSVSTKKRKSRTFYCFIIFGLEFMTIWSMDSFVWTSSHHNLYYFETAFTQLLSTVNTWKLRWWLIFRRNPPKKLFIQKVLHETIRMECSQYQNYQYDPFPHFQKKIQRSEGLTFIAVKFIIWLPVVSYYCKELHLRCYNSPRPTSKYAS